jgi:GDPmannose 4,6-dehydratase
MTALVFGANGQDGYYLGRLLENQGVLVTNFGRQEGVLPEFVKIERLINAQRPDYVFHLAAKSSTRHEHLFENHETIATGTLSILEAVYRSSPHTKVFLSGSGLQFVNRNGPIKETDEFEARNAYSIARIQSVYAARYFRTLGVKAYVGYFFHHESPFRKSSHVSKMVSSAVHQIAQGTLSNIKIGSLGVRKEWTFAGDVVEAIWKLVNQERIYEACIGSGEPHSIQEWVAACFAEVGLDWKKHVEQDVGFVPEYDLLVSDPTVIRSLGWSPKVGFFDLVKMFMAKPS